MRHLEGLDPTAEAENDMADVEPATTASSYRSREPQQARHAPPPQQVQRAHQHRQAQPTPHSYHARHAQQAQQRAAARAGAPEFGGPAGPAYTPAGEMPAQVSPYDLANAGSTNAQSAPDMQSMTRALRELEAAKARVERDAARAAQELREKLVVELLPILDNLDRTIQAAEKGREANALVEGVRMVRSQFMGTLQRMGVERIDSRHQPFNPAIHEAVGTVPVTHPAAHNVVVDQLEAGYRFGERLLRPAKVVVGRHTPRWH
jgi:molecular chaperone GrpE